MSNTGFLLLALVAGMFLSSQGLINGRLSAAFGNPLMAALISFSVGFLFLLVLNVVLVTGRYAPAPTLAKFAGLPWWIWTGGLLGALIVSAAAAAVPRIGAATYVSAIICAQLIGAAALDHFGTFGYEPRPVSWGKILGMLCLGLGVFLVRRG